MADKENTDIKYIVRVCNTDLDGHKALQQALTKIKGIGRMFANAICVMADMDPAFKTGKLSEQQIAKLNDVAKNPSKYKIPIWMLNRRNDPEKGEDMHLLTADLDFVKANDIKLMQKIKCYKGLRHYAKLPVRGQRTKSNFRKNKGKAAGVKKKGAKK